MDIQFKPIELSDLELLRLHRNQPLTHKWLESEELISTEQQLAWFRSDQARFFRIIQDGDNKIGVARIKHTPNQFVQIGMDLFIEFRGKRLASFVFDKLTKDSKQKDNILELWVFLDNKAAVKTYINAGFEFDTSCPVKFFLRAWDPTGNTYPYARMLLKVEKS